MVDGPECEAEAESPGQPSDGKLPEDGGKGPILFLVIGVVLLVVSILLVAGGAYLVWLGSAPADADGYVVSDTNTMPPLDSYAVIVDLVELDMDQRIPGILRGFETEDVVMIRLKAMAQSGKELFVGVATDEDAGAYLRNVRSDYATNYYWRVSPRNVTLKIDDAMPQGGGAPIRAPTEEVFWLASAQGSPSAVVEWAPESGFYWIVFMNADGSPGIQANIELGARFPVLRWLSWLILAIGAVLMVAALSVVRRGQGR